MGEIGETQIEISKNEPPKAIESPRKEKENFPKFDSVIVFGQGPVKPILFHDELTPEQKTTLEEFKKDPLHKTEPDFRAVDLKEGQDREVERAHLQKLGRMALNRWGRQNALAAGATLYAGVSEEIILSGGKTKPAWAKKEMPSEAELMKDIIVRIYGEAYYKKYGKPITRAIKLEDKSTNTLENFANTVNTYPKIESQKVGLLATDFHLRRAQVIANVFSVEPNDSISAQDSLTSRAQQKGKKIYLNMLKHMTDSSGNEDLKQRIIAEEKWERGLTDPRYLSYWVGYVSEVENPRVLAEVISDLKDSSWLTSAKETFLKVGLNFDDFSEEDISKLKSNDPEKFEALINGLKKLKTPEFRKMPT